MTAAEVRFKQLKLKISLNEEELRLYNKIMKQIDQQICTEYYSTDIKNAGTAFLKVANRLRHEGYRISHLEGGEDLSIGNVMIRW